MTFGKGFLIAALSIAFFALSNPVIAETAEAKAPAIKAEVAKPVVTPTPTPVTAQPSVQNGGQKVPAIDKIEQQQKADVKNLPKNVTPLIPNDGDSFILSVGETKLITAARPRICLEKEAPSFEDTKLRLPQTDLLSYSDGGLHERFSQRCGGNMPARAILVTGLKAGTQKLVILGALLTIIVK